MGKMIKLTTIEEFDSAVANDHHIFLLKHSATCPISQAAYEEYEKFVGEHDGIEAYYLVVQEARPLSNHIAEKYEIKHESPQAILLEGNQAVWNTSHWNITEKSLSEICQETK